MGLPSCFFFFPLGQRDRRRFDPQIAARRREKQLQARRGNRSHVSRGVVLRTPLKPKGRHKSHTGQNGCHARLIYYDILLHIT